MIIQRIDNVNFQMKVEHDFSFLSKYGKVFCAFDHNDSGNISFGVAECDNRFFIKVAGAHTSESTTEAKKSVEVLKNAMPLYESLKQLPNIIELIEHYEIKDLYIAVFKWAEVECLFDYWNFDKYSNNALIKSPYQKFKLLPIEKRLKFVKTMFEFLEHIEKMGYVAIDFYDGSIMYDFKNDITTICDIDFFRKKPTYNDMGQNFWGTKRLKAPEEYIYGADIDEFTNVFTLGALILNFFGNYTKADINQMYQHSEFFPCSFENWELSKELYEVVTKAASSDRNNRYNSITNFFTSWNVALSSIDIGDSLRLLEYKDED